MALFGRIKALFGARKGGSRVKATGTDRLRTKQRVDEERTAPVADEGDMVHGPDITPDRKARNSPDALG